MLPGKAALNGLLTRDQPVHGFVEQVFVDLFCGKPEFVGEGAGLDAKRRTSLEEGSRMRAAIMPATRSRWGERRGAMMRSMPQGCREQLRHAREATCERWHQREFGLYP